MVAIGLEDSRVVTLCLRDSYLVFAHGLMTEYDAVRGQKSSGSLL